MLRIQIFLSKIFLGSLLLTSTAHAYPIEYFPAALELYPQQPIPIRHVIPESNQSRERVRFGNNLQSKEVNISIEPVKSSSNFITRSEFLKATIEGIYPNGLPANCTEQLSPSNYWLYFRDVPTSADYGPHLCVAMIMGMVSGYSDVTFKPHRPINFAEASKILTKAHGLVTDSQDMSKEWFSPYVETMNAYAALPAGVILDEYVSPSTMTSMVQALSRR